MCRNNFIYSIGCLFILVMSSFSCSYVELAWTVFLTISGRGFNQSFMLSTLSRFGKERIDLCSSLATSAIIMLDSKCIYDGSIKLAASANVLFPWPIGPVSPNKIIELLYHFIAC